jgi:phage recombination protein Bet
MSTQVAVANSNAPSVITDMAARFGMEKRAFEATLKATVVPANVTNEQFVAFLLVAKQYNLNPITKEIYAFPARNGGIQPIVGVDGWCNIINSHPQLNGIQFEDRLDAQGGLTAITCKIYRKDREHPVETTEYMSECKRETETWKKWPARMLRHKALIQAARYAFGFSGLVDPDEAERAIEQAPDNKPYDVDVTKKKSPFKTATLRNTFVSSCVKAIQTAQSPADILRLKNIDAARFAEMSESGDDRDAMGLEEINKHFEMAYQRLATPAEDVDTFDEEEVPPHIRREYEEAQASGLLPKEGV